MFKPILSHVDHLNKKIIAEMYKRDATTRKYSKGENALGNDR